MKKIVFIVVLFILVFEFSTLAQNSILPIYKMASDFVAVYEEKGFETVRLDFNILTTNDLIENTRRKLYKDYEYFD